MYISSIFEIVAVVWIKLGIFWKGNKYFCLYICFSNGNKTFMHIIMTETCCRRPQVVPLWNPLIPFFYKETKNPKTIFSFLPYLWVEPCAEWCYQFIMTCIKVISLGLTSFQFSRNWLETAMSRATLGTRIPEEHHGIQLMYLPLHTIYKRNKCFLCLSCWFVGLRTMP